MQIFDYKYILGIISGLFILFSCGENTGAQGSRGYVPSGYEIPYLPGEKTEETAQRPQRSRFGKLIAPQRPQRSRRGRINCEPMGAAFAHTRFCWNYAAKRGML